MFISAYNNCLIVPHNESIVNGIHSFNGMFWIIIRRTTNRQIKKIRQIFVYNLPVCMLFTHHFFEFLRFFGLIAIPVGCRTCSRFCRLKNDISNLFDKRYLHCSITPFLSFGIIINTITASIENHKILIVD